MYEPQRVLAFHLNQLGLWELKKIMNAEVWTVELNGGVWVVTSRKESAYNAFNNLIKR